MLYFDKIEFYFEVSDGTDVNKSGKLKECMICLYWYFLDSAYKYEPEECNSC